MAVYCLPFTVYPRLPPAPKQGVEILPGKARRFRQGLPGVYGGSQCFYAFSSNAAPFAPGRGYALLEYGGCDRAAAQALRQLGYGERR